MKNITHSIIKNGRLVTTLCIAFSLMLAATVLGFLYIELPKQAAFKETLDTVENTYNIVKFKSVQQTFVASRDGLTGINLKMHVPESDVGKYKSQLLFRLRDQNGKTLQEQTISAENIKNYGNYTVSFAPMLHSTHSQYIIEITPDKIVADEKIDLFVNQKSSTYGSLKINGTVKKNLKLEYDGIYQTSSLGSLYNGRISTTVVTIIIICCVISVILLSGIVGFFLRQEN